MTKEHEEKYKAKKLDIFYNEIYNLESENAFSVTLVIAKQKERDVTEKEFVSAKNAFDELETALMATTGGKKKKLSDESKKALSLAKNKSDGAEFKLTSIKGRLSKLHEEIAEKARQIRAINKNIAFLEALDLSKVPQLPYLEVNGTRYKAVNNAHVHDEDGNLVLYIESHDKTNPTPQSA